MADFYTDDDVLRVVDVLDEMTLLDIYTTPITTDAKSVEAADVVHSWPCDVLASRGKNDQVEGSDVSSYDSDSPVKATNFCQIIRKTVRVTNTQKAIKHYGQGNDQYAYKMMKRLEEFKGDVEYNVILGTLASGDAANSTGRQMDGLRAWCLTGQNSTDMRNADTPEDGVLLSETILNAMLNLVWNQTGKYIDKLFVSGTQKRTISLFQDKSARNVPETSARLFNRVDIYESDFGVQEIFKSIDLQSNDDNEMLGVVSDYIRLAWLRRPIHEPLAKTGSSTKGMIEGELSLEVLDKGDACMYLATKNPGDE